jgi:outer membrane protein assembly factor BamB
VGRAGIAAFAKYGETVYVSAFVSRRDESLLYAIDARTGKKAGWHVRLDARPEIIRGDSRSLLIGGDALQLLRP